VRLDLLVGPVVPSAQGTNKGKRVDHRLTGAYKGTEDCQGCDERLKLSWSDTRVGRWPDRRMRMEVAVKPAVSRKTLQWGVVVTLTEIGTASLSQ